VPIIGMANIKDGRIYPDNASKVELTTEQYNTYKLNKGDLLFNRTNSAALVGKTAVVSEDMPFVFASYIVRLIIDSKTADSYYLGYILSTWDSAAKLRSLATPGVSQYNINPTTLKKHFWVALPPVQEQERIVEVLKLWDRAIDLTEKLLAEKQELRRGVGQQLLTGKRRLHGFEKGKGRRKTLWGTYPQDWEYPRIAQVAKNVSVKNSEGIALPVLSCTKHRGLVDSMEYFGKQVFSKDLSTYKVVLRGQFAYATNHIEEGSIGYQDLHDSAVISPMYTVFEAGPMIEDRFLFLLLKTDLYRHIFEINTSASVDRRGSLRWTKFSRLRVPVPSLDEQQAIIRVFSLLDREVELIETKINSLRVQKKGLMQQLLTGKKRVTECAS
jgi:type I restriction enzyme S subunit